MQRVCLKSSTSLQRCFFGYRFKQNWPTSILFFLPFYCHHQIYSLRLQTLSTIPCLTFASFSRFSSPNRHPNRMYDVSLQKQSLLFIFATFYHQLWAPQICNYMVTTFLCWNAPYASANLDDIQKVFFSLFLKKWVSTANSLLFFFQ